MKLTLQTRLLPDESQGEKLKATVERFNEAANWLAGEAFERKMANKIGLHKLFYRDLRTTYGLSAQMACLCIARVAEAYKRDKKKRPKFRPHAAMTYDQRIMSFKGVDRVSLLTLEGRVIVPFIMGKYQQEKFTNAKGQADLVLRKDGKWFLLVTVDVPDGAPTPTTDFIGVDLGVANIATTDDGQQYSGHVIENVRQKFHNQRQSLQKAAAASKAEGKRPKNIRRKLKVVGSKEQRFRRDVSHTISKQLVAKAKDTDKGIALEDLKGIRNRTRFRKPQRAKMSGWAFAQLRNFIEYKAQLTGVWIKVVDPKNTSRTCAECGHCEKSNRQSQDSFLCKQCGHQNHADINAARNIRARALVSAPIVSPYPASVAAAG
jgi:putative transposase